MTPAAAALNLCANWLKVRNPSDMDADHRLLLLSAMVSGIGEYYSLVPARFREKHWGARFSAAGTGTITATAGATAVTVAGITPVDGCTVEIAGDAVKNTLLKTAAGGWELAIPYGGTTGSGKTLTVYRDTAVLLWTFNRFITPMRNALTNEEIVSVPSGYDYTEASSDIPQAFRVEQAGQSQIVRILPLPTGDIPAKATLELSGVAFGGIGVLTDPSATALPMTDDHATRFVLPLTAAHLLTHPLWREPGMVRVASEHAARARADMQLLSPRADSGPRRIIAPCP